MSQKLDRVLSKFVQRVRDERVYGRLGRTNADATVTITVETRPDNVYITMDGGTLIDLPNKGKGRVPLRAGLPVQMVRHYNGELVIDGQDDRLLENDAGEPSNAYAVKPHPLEAHTNVVITAPATDEVLKYNGTNWVNDTGGGGAVDSVNGFTGVVVLDPDDLDDTSTTHKFTTAAEISKLAGIEALADVTDAGNVGAVNAAATSKNPPIDADSFPIVDSAASNVIKRVTFTNLKAFLKTYFDTLYDLTGTAITALTTKTTPVDADHFVITDSAASNVPKRVTGTNLKVYLKAYFDTLYATVGGWIKADGTVPLTAEWDIGEDMSIRAERLEARDAEGLRLEDDGGNLGLSIEDGGRVTIENATYPALLTTRLLTAVTTGVRTAFSIRSTTTGNMTDGFATGFSFELNDSGVAGQNIIADIIGSRSGGDTSASIRLRPYSAGSPVEAVTIMPSGNVGLTTASPQGILHAHDGTGGQLFVTKTAIDGSAQTIIPDGTGDVVQGLFFLSVVKPSTGAAFMTSNTIANNSNADVYNSGGNILNLRVNSNGSVDVRRTGGSLTYTLSLFMIWL